MHMNFIHISDIHGVQLNIYHPFREYDFKADASFTADSPKITNLLLEQNINVCGILLMQAYYDVKLYL